MLNAPSLPGPACPLLPAATQPAPTLARLRLVPQAYKTYRLGGQVSELLYSPAAYGIDLSARDALRPRARAAPMLAVLRGTLWLLGGQVEVAHTDIVLDDLWYLDLAKLDGWKCVRENTVGEEAFRELSEGEWATDSDDGGGGSDG